jgi:outer membrane protein assembly factor BamB
MRLFWGFAVFCLVLTSTTLASAAPDENWPTWRGPQGNGLAVKGNPPVTWSESENVKWKIALPGTGNSTPIVWGDKIFIQTAVPTAEEPTPPVEAQRPPERPQRAEAQRGQGGDERGRRGGRGGRRRGGMSRAVTVPYKFNVVCLERATGKVVWEKTVREELPHEGHHPTGSLASYSPVTDGKLLWASFGSRGLHCFDLDGNVKWSTDLVRMSTRNSFGE